MNNLPLISIQILNWNRAEDTQRAIASAYAQTYPNFEVVLVDNGSSDHSIRLTKTNFPTVKILELEKNFGCAGGRNRGIDYCSGKYIFYLDNDGVLHKDAVLHAYQAIISKKDIKIITGKVYPFNDLKEIDTRFEVKNEKILEAPSFQGGICLHDKSLYRETGCYPDHFVYGSEELFLSLKLLDSSYKIYKNEAVILWHVRSNVQRNRKLENLNSFYNKLYTAVALYPLEKMIQFVFYFMFIYPIYAFKEGILADFSFIKVFEIFREALQHRNPIKRETFRNYRHILSQAKK